MTSEPTAFGTSPQLAELRCTYPPYQDVLDAIAAGEREREVVARLWISEGIPFAFKDCPGVYDEARAWLARGLEIEPKEVSIRGSGRLGYSLGKYKKHSPYRPGRSDLDFFAVSQNLFTSLRQEFESWRREYKLGLVQPRTDAERRYWPRNREQVARNVRRGFIDSNRVPNMDRYPRFQGMNDRLARLKNKLLATNDAPDPGEKITLRCYRDWSAMERQQQVNLEDVVVVQDARRPSG